MCTSTPRDPDVLYAVAFQRRRHVGVLVAGGPESGVWKSTDGGETWRDITRGLPAGDLGRIALAVSPVDPDVVYALAAATEDRSGFYRSPDRGETWVRMSDYIVVDPQYYGEIYPDPHRMDRVYAVDVIIHVTEDGGRSFDRVNTRFKHVDNHEIVFDPDNPDYMLVGSDGGLYETFDGTRTWRYVSGNMPLMQFYRVGIDNKAPFYTVYGGTQDNSSVGGPVAHRQRPRDPKQRLVHHPRGRRLSRRASTRRTRTSSTRSPSTRVSSATTGRAARNSTSSRSPSRGRGRCAGTGIRR